MNTTRRQALQSLGLGGLAVLSGRTGLLAEGNRKKLPVAAVVTTYSEISHADVIVGKILEGWRQKGGVGPDLELVSLYTDQVDSGDLSRGLAKKHGFRDLFSGGLAGGNHSSLHPRGQPAADSSARF